MKRYLLSLIAGLAASMLPAPAAFAAQEGTSAASAPPAAADNTQRQYETFRQAQQQFRQKTANLRQQVRLKHHELASLWLSPNATQEELLKKQRELQDARAALERERLSFMFQMKQQGIDFDHYGMMGYGMMGHHGMRGGHGMGPGMMGGPMGTGAMGDIAVEPDMMMEEGWW